MDGVRVLEVAQFTFVPASGAVLTEWGADVIKVEHAVAGDAQRGLVETPVASRRAPQFAEHTDEILRELGKTDDELIELTIAGAVT
jgi:crotonobetainyl-CoA:carnitine CoA-transferase CaiB-like acyl-CoA transferase